MRLLIWCFQTQTLSTQVRNWDSWFSKQVSRILLQRNKHFSTNTFCCTKKTCWRQKSDEISEVSLEKLLTKKVLKIVCSEFTMSYRARVKTRKLLMEIELKKYVMSFNSTGETTQTYRLGLGLILVSLMLGIYVKDLLIFYLEEGRSTFLSQCCCLRTFVPAWFLDHFWLTTRHWQFPRSKLSSF